MRKEIVTYVATNEEDTEVSVQRVSDDTDYVLLRLGSFAVAINRHELIESLETLSLYGRIFDEEKNRKDNAGKLEESRALAAKKQATELQTMSLGMKPKSKKNKVHPEDEGALILTAENRSEPTASEIHLLNMMEGLPTFKG